ncbi:hypothetical protein CC86DRAFT_453845 [Ophiobolus disseminans]|uniref:Ubiquitin-like protease family profile domain-containing protein n=1 Tax=Ophiobolus disseminans TaxID=1469910 RepID=A0A6A7A8W2_9PLEO|nr:hypothetical protein CC86DRAFT_453845 [Ophiobolus disseminans]
MAAPKKRLADYAFQLDSTGALVIQPRPDRQYAIAKQPRGVLQSDVNFSPGACPSPDPYLPGEWPRANPRASALRTYDDTLESSNEPRRPYIYFIQPLAFLLALPFRLLWSYLRPRQVIAREIVREDGSRKRRIIETGSPCTPHTPTPSHKTVQEKSLVRQGRVESLGDRLRRVEEIRVSPPTPYQDANRSPQSLFDGSFSFDVSFNVEHFITGTPPYPGSFSGYQRGMHVSPTGPYDSLDGPAGCTEFSPDTPRIVPGHFELSSPIRANVGTAVDLAANHIDDTPQAVRDAPPVYNGRNISPGAPLPEVNVQQRNFLSGSALAPKPFKSPEWRLRSIRKFPRTFVPDQRPGPKFKFEMKNKQPSVPQHGAQAVLVARVPGISRPPTSHPINRSLRAGQPVLHTHITDCPYLPIVPEGVLVGGNNPEPSRQLHEFSQNLLQAQYEASQQSEQAQLFAQPQQGAQSQFAQSQQFVQSQQFPQPQQHVPSAAFHVRETINFEHSHLQDAPEADYDRGSAIHVRTQPPSTTFLAPPPQVATPVREQAVWFASKSEVKHIFIDEKAATKMEAKLEVASPLKIPASEALHGEKSSVHKAPAPSTTIKSSSARVSTIQAKTSDVTPDAIQDEAAVITDVPASTQAGNQDNNPSSAPVADEELQEVEFSIDFSQDLSEALPSVEPKVPEEQTPQPAQREEVPEDDDNSYGSLFGANSPEFQAAVSAVKALVTPLTEEEQAALDAAAVKTDHGKLKEAFVVDPKMTAADFGTLLPEQFNGSASAWLNDSIVNDYFTILVKAVKQQDNFPFRQKMNTGVVPRVHAFSSFWYETISAKNSISKAKSWAKRAHIGGPRFLEAELVLFPICHANHWRLMAVKPRDRTIEYLDSLNMPGSKYIKKMKEWLADELADAWIEDEWTVIRQQRSTQQINGRDCGVFTALNALALLRGMDLTTVLSCDGMMDARKRMAATIMKQAPTTEFD